MKRKFIVFLCAALLISCMAVPASATSLEDNPNLVTDLLDYGHANESSTNFRNFQGQGSMTYSMPSAGIVSYIDVVFDFWGGTLDRIEVLRNGVVYDVLPVHHVTGYTYRVYGNLTSTPFVNIGLNFISTSTSYCYVSIKSFKVGDFKSTVKLTEAYCQITSYNYEKTIHYVPTDESNKRSWVNDYNDGSINYSLNLWAEDWENYDFIDFFLFTVVGSVDSISCTMSGHAVPFSVSYIDSSDDSESYYTYVIRLDLRELDRFKGISGDYPLVIVDGQQVVYGMTNLISVLSVTGFTEYQDSNPVIYWLQYIYDSLKSGLSTLSTAITNQTTAIGSHFTSLGNWISNQTTSISSHITDRFTALSGWISTQTQNLNVYLTRLQTELVTQADQIEAAIRGDPAPGNSFQDEVDQKENELDQMAAVMDSVSKPDINSINVSVDRYVSAADVNTLTAPLTVFLTGDIFGSMVVMSILMATVSYVLYGKKG